jgi:hypothetical protein
VLVGNGESQLPAPHRDYAGASIHAPVRFLHPPLSSRTARFPRSGWKRRHILVEPARHAVGSSGGAHTLAASQFAPRLVWFGWHSVSRTLSSERAFRSRPSPPRAPLLQRHYPPSLLIRAHAQIPVPLVSISCPALIAGAPAACTIHGWSAGPSRFGPPFFPGVLRPLYRRFAGCT